jgi:hypothetical protein
MKKLLFLLVAIVALVGVSFGAYTASNHYKAYKNKEAQKQAVVVEQKVSAVRAVVRRSN